MHEGRHQVEGFQLCAHRIPHEGGRTFGYRVSDGRSSFAYIPDHLPGPAGPARDAVLALCRGVDLLIHDAQFLPGEAAIARAQGHATTEEAVALAIEAEAAEVALFHHSPSRTDVDLEEIIADLATSSIGITLAREGCERSLASSRDRVETSKSGA